MNDMTVIKDQQDMIESNFEEIDKYHGQDFIAMAGSLPSRSTSNGVAGTMPEPMKRIAYLCWGAASQITSFQDFSRYLDEMIYLRELETHDLGRYAAVVVPDGMDGAGIRRYAAQLNAYVRGGGFLIVFVDKGAPDWIDVVDLAWRPVKTRDWLWWTRPDPYLEIRQPEPGHPLCEVISLADMSWHWSGAFDLNPSALSALNLDDDSGSLLLDFQTLEGGGRLMVSTLDPHLHNGERFMPATTRFLQAFYPWLNRELGIKRDKPRFAVTYLQCLENSAQWAPPEELARAFADAGGRLALCPQYQLGTDDLAGADILYIPYIHDQFHLRRLQPLLLKFLGRGGHMVICSEPAIQWLPFLGAFQAVPPRPFSNLKVRVRNDPFGIFGQYARGWSNMPEGAVWLTDVGSQNDPKPADWLWQYPTDTGKGGMVFMHHGDNLTCYPDHGAHRQCLVRDICLGLMAHAGTMINRF